MRNVRMALTTSFVSALLAAAGAGAAGPEQLKGTQFIQVLNGNTLAGKNSSGVDYRVYFLTGGIVTYENDEGIKDTGRWRVHDDGSICLTLLKRFKGEERCTVVMIEGRELSWRGEKLSGKGRLLGTIF